MDTGVRITTKPNGNHERAQREQSSPPYSSNLPHEVHSKGESLLPRELSSQLCPVEEKSSCTTILCQGWGKRSEARYQRRPGNYNLWVLEVHLECRSRPRCQTPVLHLRRRKGEQVPAGAEAEPEPGPASAAISAPATAASPLGYTHQGQPGYGPIRHGNEGEVPPITRILSTLSYRQRCIKV